MSGALLKYDAAVRALAEAKSVDEVKNLRTEAEMMRAYARQAKDTALETDAAEIRFRAERRLGEMIDGQRDAGLLSSGGRPSDKTGLRTNPVSAAPTLAEAGIDKNLANRARKLAAIPQSEFDATVSNWREKIQRGHEKVSLNLLRSGERAQQTRRENDFYPTPESLIAEIAARWEPLRGPIWEPCAGDGRIVRALGACGREVIFGDIAEGNDFFAERCPPDGVKIVCTNPPYDRAREFIDHAFAIGVEEMCLVLPERFWASGVGRQQFERHRPAIWVNLDWREDYLGKGGAPDRALGVAIWDSPCAARCDFQVWTRTEGEGASDAETGPAEIGSDREGPGASDTDRHAGHPPEDAGAPAFDPEPATGGNEPDAGTSQMGGAQNPDPRTPRERFVWACIGYAPPDGGEAFAWDRAGALDILKAGYAAKITAGEIGKVLGTSAGAVFGKANRLELTEKSRQGARTDLRGAPRGEGETSRRAEPGRSGPYTAQPGERAE